MSPARQREADRVEVIYYYALGKLTNALAADALDLYSKNVPAAASAASNTSWLTAVLRMLFGFRTPATRLAVSYYRLTRALRTGYAPTLEGEDEGDLTSLEDLRAEFEKVVEDIERETLDAPGPEVQLPADDGHREEQADVELENVTDITKLIEEREEADRQQAIDQLDQLGIGNLAKDILEISDGDESRSAKVTKAHETAAARQAAAAMRIMQNAARGLVYDLGSTDLRLQGWIRYSASGDPCAFCAMLISRGLTLYSTRKAAQHQGKNQDEDKYHDNCRCVAVPVFVLSQYDSELFDANRYYADLWVKHIKGKYSGKDALNKWREYLRKGFPGQELEEAA